MNGKSSPPGSARCIHPPFKRGVEQDQCTQRAPSILDYAKQRQCPSHDLEEDLVSGHISHISITEAGRVCQYAVPWVLLAASKQTYGECGPMELHSACGYYTKLSAGGELTSGSQGSNFKCLLPQGFSAFTRWKWEAWEFGVKLLARNVEPSSSPVFKERIS